VHRVARRGHPQELLDAHDLGGAAAVEMGDDREIEIAVLDACDEVRRRLAHDRHFGARIGAGEAGEDLGKVAVGVIVGQAEPDAADELVLVERCDALGVEPHDPAGVVEEPLALVGQLRLAAVAFEDRAADALLEPLHLHRNRALGLVDDVGGAREGAGIGDGDERPQLVDIEEMHRRLHQSRGVMIHISNYRFKL
jgi:hypothetical protein